MADAVEVKPVTAPVATVRVPGSRSCANRAMLIAALAEGDSNVRNFPSCDDCRLMVEALRSCGVKIDQVGKEEFLVHGVRGTVPLSRAQVNAGDAGTVARFMTAFVALGHGRYSVDGSKRMRQRPIQDLVDALLELGVDIWCVENNGCPPLEIRASGLRGGAAVLSGTTSSQFLSAILMVAPYAERDVEIHIRGELVSRSYIDMTLRAMRQFDVTASREGYFRFHVKSGQTYQGHDYVVEGDASSAAYFMAAAAITQGKITVLGVGPQSLQGDIRFASILATMGCKAEGGADWIRIAGGPLSGIDADLNETPDLVLPLAVTAAFASTPTVIRNVANLRVKESDRLSALATELQRMGITAHEGRDSLEILPGNPQPCEIRTYDDHRMAMSFAVAGLRVKGLRILDPDCASKTFPNFFDELSSITEVVRITS